MVGRTISHYKITGKLGEGAMGEVWKAEDTDLGRPVALKFIGSHLLCDEEARQRFTREARAAASLNHPNICTIYELGEANAAAFIAMELVEGESLDSKMLKGRLSIEEATGLCAQIADGLQEAHTKGLVHRDIKPQNLMLTPRGAIKIMDFGLALFVRDVAQTRGGVGTPLYMSPEQVQGEAVDQRTDIWSLGAVLYEMLAARPPFQEEHEAALFYSIVNEEPEPLDTPRPDLPPHLVQVVARALRKDRCERYTSAAEFRIDLETVAEGRTPPAIPVGTNPPLGLAEDERVQAAILVSNLGGLVELVEDLSSDRLDQVVDHVHERIAEIIAEHDGIMSQFSDEELVAVFGVSAGSEDYAARAARTALKLHRTVGEFKADPESDTRSGLWLSSGIDSGLVHTRTTASDAAPRVTGVTQRVAASLGLHADPGEILMSGDCRRLLPAHFETDPQPPLRLRGVKQSVTPYQLKAESEAADPIASSEALSPFAGREAELSLLTSCLDQALSGQGRIVTVVGDAGLGKTRLLHEFQRPIGADRACILQGRCQPHETGSPFLPFVQLLKGLFRRVADSDLSLSAKTVKQRALEIDSELGRYLPTYLHLLALQSEDYPLPDDFGRADSRAAVLEALSSIFILAAGRQPLVLLFEDWHWSDNASREVLDQLAEVIADHPILVAVTSRPEYSFGSLSLTHHTPIRLHPLEPSNSLEIVKATLAARSISDEVEKVLLERTGCNPFYLEELCRALREEGSVSIQDGTARLTSPIEELKLPATVQAAIRSRLQRLQSADREVLRIASVIGDEFRQGLLSEVWGERPSLEASLSSLREAALVRRVRIGSNAAYRFGHAMIHQVVYSSLLRRQRKSLHQTVGETLEAQLTSGIEGQASRLARHFREAGAWEKAHRYGKLAVDRNWRISRYAEALAELELAEKAVREFDDDAKREEALIEVLLQQERLCETTASRDRQQRIIDQLLSILEPRGPSSHLVEAYIRLGDLNALRENFETCHRGLNKALDLSRHLAAADLELRTLRSLTFAYSRQGRFDEALGVAEELVVRDRERDNPSALVKDLAGLSLVLRNLGRHDRALTVVNEALAINNQHEDIELRAIVAFNRAQIYRDLGDTEAALKDIKTALDQSPLEKQGALSFAAKPGPLLIAMSSILMERGEIEQSLEWCKKAVDWGRRSRMAEDEAYGHRQSGLVLISAGRDEEALPHLEEAAETYQRMEYGEEEAVMQRSLATVHEKIGNLEAATEAWNRFLVLDCGLKARLDAFESLGRIVRKRGEPSQTALRNYMDALQLAIELDDPSKQADLHNTIGVVHWASGAYEAALESYRQGLAICRRLDDRPHASLMLNSIGVTLHRLARNEEALSALDDALLLQRELGAQTLEGHALAAAGDIHVDLQQFEQARHCYEQSLEIRKSRRDRKGEGWMLHRLASVKLAEGNRDAAKELADRAVAIATEEQVAGLVEACSRFQG